MLIYWLSKLLLLISQFQHVGPYLQPVFAVLVFIGWGPWAKVLVSLYFMVMICNTGELQQQSGMDLAMDLYLAVPLLFTVLALVLTSVFVRLRGAKGEWPAELPAAGAARESGPRDPAAAGAGPEARRVRLPVEEVGAVEEGKEAAAEQWEEATEEPSPAAESSPAAAKSIPREPPAEPHEPKPQKDAESKILPVGASAGPSPGHPGQMEDAGDQTAFSSKAEEEDLDSEKEKLVVRAGKHSSYTSPSDKYSSII
ncbi:cytochrome c1-like [Pezoporus flaviventris]|uniref:cytochrome c1-like n=1 Tax=Pezoporus flaviventris TaxID=889875 RepID=UPI002AB1FAD0|nr:cytochrome c1-like [Pezoporus flaviventris]